MHVIDNHYREIETILNQGKIGEYYNISIIILVVMMASLQIYIYFDNFSKSWTNYLKPLSIMSTYFQKPPIRENFQKPYLNMSLLKHVTTDRPKHDRRYAIDSTKIRNKLGFKFTIPLKIGLSKTIKWFLENPKWWRSLISQKKQHSIAA